MRAEKVDDTLLKMVITYAEERLRCSRRVSPITARVLQLYKNPAQDALEVPPDDTDTKIDLAATLRAFETQFHI